MRGQAKQWGIPTTLTIIYKPSQDAWFASFTVNVEAPDSQFSSNSDLSYQSILAIDLGTQTAITGYDGTNFTEVENPRFVRQGEKKVQKLSKQLRRKKSPNWKKKIKASKRWKKARKKVSQLQRKIANQRRNWQHQVTTEIKSCYDIVVTEKLETKKMTKKAKKGSKRKRQKAGLNKSILDVGFGTLNKMIVYKVEAKGGLVIELDTKQVKPSQRCPKCGIVHKDWADLSNRYHFCNDCYFEGERDRTSCVVMYNVATNVQPGLGISLVAVDALSSTSEPRIYTGTLKQLGQMKRSKSQQKTNGEPKPHRHALG
jgi:putative transposase